MEQKEKEQQSPQNNQLQPDSNNKKEEPNREVEEKDNAIKRIGRGFKVMLEKLKDSKVVKNLQAEQKGELDLGWPTMNDIGINNKSVEKENKKLENKKLKEIENERKFWATDFNNMDAGI